ncbi:MAG: hypothetical protein R6U13_07210, partial [Desulfatiglandaceae bacterium]
TATGKTADTDTDAKGRSISITTTTTASLRSADNDLTSRRIKAAEGVSMREIHHREGAPCEWLR